MLIPDEMLIKLPFADFYIKNILLDLRVTDFQLQFEAINNLSKVALYSEDSLYTHEISIHSLFKEVNFSYQWIEFVDNKGVQR